MTRIALNVDIAPHKYIVIVGVVSSVLLLIHIIAGAASPPTTRTEYHKAFTCNDSSNVFNHSICTGYNPSSHAWSPWLDIRVKTLNKGWYLVLVPYSTASTIIRRDVTFAVDLEALKQGSGHWATLLQNDTTKSHVFCSEAKERCDPLLLVFEDVSNYDHYRIRVKVVSDVSDFLGNLEFQVTTNNEAFQRLYLGFKMTHLAISAIISVFVVILLARTIRNWEWETKILIVLLLALILSNGPLFLFQYLSSGWVIVFLNAFFELAFVCTIFGFWLMYIDRLKEMDSATAANQPLLMRIPKYVLISLYFVLTSALYVLASVRFRMMPLFTLPESVSGIQILFYLSAALYMALILWLAIVIVLVIPLAYSNRNLFVRFMYFGIPTTLCILSLLIAVFSGSMGAFGAKAFGSIYFIGLWNIYIYVILWGHWPLEAGFGVAGYYVPEETRAFVEPKNQASRYA